MEISANDPVQVQRKEINDGNDFDVRSAFGCSLIVEAGVLLGLPQICVANAQIIFHRFFVTQSFECFSAVEMAAACIFLAAKMEEKTRRVSHLLATMEYVEFRRRQGDYVQECKKEFPSYKEKENKLLWNEMFLLRELGFRLYSNMERIPHRYLVFFVQTVQSSPEKQEILAQKAWNYLNDSFRINLCVKYSSQVIATASIFLAARQMQIALPLLPEPWWRLFEVSDEQLEDVVLRIMGIYKMKFPKWIN